MDDAPEKFPPEEWFAAAYYFALDSGPDYRADRRERAAALKSER